MTPEIKEFTDYLKTRLVAMIDKQDWTVLPWINGNLSLSKIDLDLQFLLEGKETQLSFQWDSKPSDLIEAARELGLEVHNACNDPCDTINGPCACGSWHTTKDFLERILVFFDLKNHGFNKYPKR